MNSRAPEESALPASPGDIAATRSVRGEALAVVTDPTGRIQFANPELLRRSGLDWAAVSGKPWFDVFAERARRSALRRAFEQVVTGAQPGPCSAVLRDGNGNEHHIVWVATRSVDATGATVSVTSVGVEVSGAGETSRPAAPGTDRLTGLAGREAFIRRLKNEIEAAHQGGFATALVLVRIDKYTELVITLGDGTGETILRELAGRLTATVANGVVARISGHEFAVLLPRVDTSADAVRMAEELVRVMRAPCGSLPVPVHLTASAGLAVYPHDAASASELMGRAGSALTRAATAGGNRQAAVEAAAGDAPGSRMMMEQQLHGAIARGELTVHYQPLVDATTHNVIGVEALARWNHPMFGDIAPGRFIPVAEQTGLIRTLGLHVLRTALEDAKAWRDAGLAPVTVAVNVSARQLAHPSFVDDVALLLAETSTPSGVLELEVTEGAVMADVEVATVALRHLTERGVGISLDDFGTGYSCIARLDRLSLTAIKIDRTFLRPGTAASEPVAMVRALVALARSLDLRVVAEGVETMDQLRSLEAEGLDLYQGFLFSRPVPAAVIQRLLAEGLPALV